MVYIQIFERYFIIYMLLDSSSNLKSNVDEKKPIQKPPQKLLQPKGEIGHLLRWRDDLPA